MALAVPDTCVTEQELLADVAMGFLFAQEISAQLCDPLLDPMAGRAGGPMVRLQRLIEAKFSAEFAHHSEIRAKYFKRLYEDNWEEKMARVIREYGAVFLSTLSLGKSECKRLLTELEIRLDSPWAYIQAKLDYSTKQSLKNVNLCK